MKLSKRLRNLRDQARKLGANGVTFDTGRRHPRLTGTDAAGRHFCLIVANSPSCRHADKNALALLRRTLSGRNP